MDAKEKEFSRNVIQDLQDGRKRMQMTQATLAERMGTTKSAVSRLEKGGLNITLETAAKYAYALGLEPEFRAGPEKPEDEAVPAAGQDFEPFSEVLAWQVARRMELNAVPYELDYRRGVLTSKCKATVTNGISFVPAEQIVSPGDVRSCLSYYRELGPDFYGQLCSMFVFDALIYNTDRHFGTFGLLRNDQTGEYLAPAPLGSNGGSLFCHASKEDFRKIEAYAETCRTPYGMTFEEAVEGRIGPLQKDQLRSMINFRFEDTEPVSLPRWRIRAIEEQLQRRVYQLLHL